MMVGVRGAEALIEEATWMGRAAIRKRRAPKAYRDPDLDGRLRAERTQGEASLLAAARRAGVPVPVLYDADRGAATITMERVAGPTLRATLSADGDEAAAARLAAWGRMTGTLHAAGITHGDLTTSNVIVEEGGGGRLVLLDFGLGASTPDAEAQGVDLHLVEEALEATDARAPGLYSAFLAGYRSANPGHAAALRRLEEIRERGRNR